MRPMQEAAGLFPESTMSTGGMLFVGSLYVRMLKSRLALELSYRHQNIYYLCMMVYWIFLVDFNTRQ